MTPLSRREALLSLGLGAAIVSHVDADGPGAQGAGDGAARGGWVYTHLAPADVAAEAYDLYSRGGCMYGVFAGALNLLGAKAGEPFRSFPSQMMKFGEGGVGGWGSLCGALNGAAALVGLFLEQKERRDAVLGELLGWYESTPLPAYRPSAESEAVATTTAKSVLCHVSSVRWCEATGSPSVGPERKERCRRLTADVAAKTIELLNRSGEAAPCFAGLSPPVQSCVDCHGKKELNNAAVKMRCDACHSFSKRHP